MEPTSLGGIDVGQCTARPMSVVGPSLQLLQRNAVSAFGGIVLQKSFGTGVQKFRGL
jgi:hypothetical protein